MQVNARNDEWDKIQSWILVNKNGRATIKHFENELAWKIRFVKYRWKVTKKDRICRQTADWTNWQPEICVYNYSMHARMHLHADQSGRAGWLR